ncbi:glycosyltransferase [Candidatus Bathyarchaeota archaeon]|nr:glycosyltransferase [Candidatus Bathyarchaeota archaeon]
MLLFLFLTALVIFSGTYFLYFLYIKKHVEGPWRLEINKNFQPEISILIPVHNEEITIASKLENIKNVSYPKNKIEIIVADDASEDNTLIKVKDFIQQNSELNIKLVRQTPRAGKSATLNKALTLATNPIIIVSDADTLWPLGMLQNALPYLSDPRVGAVTGRGSNSNVDETWATKAESTYLQFANLLRLGESKKHSTIRFEGGFCAYKKEVFEGFDCETGSDDSGTALKIVQNGYRTILVPEAIFYTNFPSSFIGRFKVKVRRANQLIGLWIKCFKLLLKKRLLLPKRIGIPEIILFIFNPIIFLVLVISGGIIVILNPVSQLSLAILVLLMCLLVFARRMFLEIVIDNIVLLYALVTFMFKRRYVAWERQN